MSELSLFPPCYIYIRHLIKLLFLNIVNYVKNLHRTLIDITLDGNGVSVTPFQPLHFRSDPLSVLSKMTCFKPS